MALGHWLKDYIGPRGSSESGGGTEPLIVSWTGEGDTSLLDKTWQEIYDAFPWVYIRSDGGEKKVVTEAFFGLRMYHVRVASLDGVIEFATDTANGYPELVNA